LYDPRWPRSGWLALAAIAKVRNDNLLLLARRRRNLLLLNPLLLNLLLLARRRRNLLLVNLLLLNLLLVESLNTELIRTSASRASRWFSSYFVIHVNVKLKNFNNHHGGDSHG
jgi:hypothetical protein